KAARQHVLHHPAQERPRRHEAARAADGCSAMSGPGRGRSSASGRAIVAALLSPVFLGAAPIFGKLATNAGVDPFTVAAVRTILAVGILWAGYLIFWREYTYIYP